MSNERPILFSGPMVRAILDGRKTQTRRLLKSQPDEEWWKIRSYWPHIAVFTTERGMDRPEWKVECPYGQPGGRLWVREAHAIVPATAYRASEGVAQTVNPHDPYYAAVYRAGFDRARSFSWRPSIHMPRWASRITLEITEIRVQRVQEVDADDVEAEGVQCAGEFIQREDDKEYFMHGENCCQEAFARLWDEINTAPGRTWEDNPWVWVIGFRRVR